MIIVPDRSNYICCPYYNLNDQAPLIYLQLSNLPRILCLFFPYLA